MTAVHDGHTGAVGAVAGSPFFRLKTQMQTVRATFFFIFSIGVFYIITCARVYAPCFARVCCVPGGNGNGNGNRSAVV